MVGTRIQEEKIDHMDIQLKNSLQTKPSGLIQGKFFNSTLLRFRWVKKFWWLILIILILIVGILVFFKKPIKNIEKSIKSVFSDFPVCPTNLSGLFTYQLVDPNQIAALIPLGNVNGSDHILPVDHVYLHSYPTEENKHLPVYAPADMTITQLTMHKVVDKQGMIVAHEHDYAIDAEICQGLKVWILAINELSPVLQSAFDQGDKRHEEGEINSNEIAVNDSFEIDYKIKAGELLGYTGEKGNGSAIEISIINENQEPDPIVDWDYYSDADRRSGIICFADLYTGSQKDELNNKFGDYISESEDKEKDIKDNPVSQTDYVFKQRTVEPVCGQVIQNSVGTIQGDWFLNKPKKEHENLEGEGKAITFIHKNTDPSRGVISISGTITDHPLMLEYQPTHSGIIDREPSEVTADGKIYCYNNNRDSVRKFLVQLMDDHHLKIEQQDGICQMGESFENPFTFER